MKLAHLVALLWLAAAPARREATVIPWAWERTEDLRFLGPRATVAWYAGILTLEGERVHIEPRRNPLFLPEDAHRIAVIRIETKKPALSRRQLEATRAAIRHIHRNAEELQLDFDATRSERAFYRALLVALRNDIDTRLSITALASWCLDDRWMRDLPIDEAVPMLFRMGRDEHAVRARLARIDAFPEPRCRASAGISMDEPLPRIPHAARVWVFNPERWTEAEWNAALSRVR
ncbi:MAG TPA: hypothetical protein VHK90_01250 [Thermoanaerobaculia bacterium]|nr:hypothetical protein [Thermoanaerobaculia bacterium]